tara:strand:- start:2902 stop:3198 length:297 start_codon:yes stop_codon:yes gene_type:complete
MGVWFVSTSIQLIHDRRPLWVKAPGIVASLMRDCHFQLFDFIAEKTKILEPIRGILLPLFNNDHCKNFTVVVKRGFCFASKRMKKFHYEFPLTIYKSI